MRGYCDNVVISPFGFCVVTGGFCAGGGDWFLYHTLCICIYLHLVPCFLLLLASLFNGMAINSSSCLHRSC